MTSSQNGPFVSVLIARNSDKLHLCAHTDPGFQGTAGQGPGNFKTQQQRILQRMQVPDGGGYVSFDHKDTVYFAFVDQATNLIFLAVASKLLWSGSSQSLENLACSLLDALFAEFLNFANPEEIVQATRPFHFIKFDLMLQKTLKRIVSQNKPSTKTVATAGSGGAQYDLLKKEIQEVHHVIKQNLEDILSRGERLETMTSYSAQLKEHSNQYQKRTARLNRMRLLKTYGPIAAIVALILLYLIWKYLM
jgi:vesicle transport protein SEC22